MRHRSLFLLIGGALALAPLPVSAAQFEVSGWLPYWRTASSTLDVLPHLGELSEIDPFVLSLKSDGTIADNAPLTDPHWQQLISQAKGQQVRVVPTLMASDGDLLHGFLSDTRSRIGLEQRIADYVKAQGFDGIDIDFEGKKAEDKDFFSTFLKGLHLRLGRKWLTCDIEARTPILSRYYGIPVPPDAAEYANDFTAIGKYCDRVRLMTYDQQTGDQKLAAEAASSSMLYAPVADPAWVTKVVELAARSIKKSKLVIGIPTYGYEWNVTAYAGGEYDYHPLWTFNPGYAAEIEDKFGVTPVRSPWGEMELTYINASPSSTTAPLGANSSAGLAAAAAVATYASSTNTHLDFRMLVWPDAQAIAGKIALAQSLGLRGVAIFKLDGGEDGGLWQVLQGVAGSTAAGRAAPPSFARGLGLGSRGPDVRALQEFLNRNAGTAVASSGPGSSGHETAFFGPATERAVGKFQVRYHLAGPGRAGYGYVGPATRARLNALLSD